LVTLDTVASLATGALDEGRWRCISAKRAVLQSEAAKIARITDASMDRSWEIWKFKALANTPKL